MLMLDAFCLNAVLQRMHLKSRKDCWRRVTTSGRQFWLRRQSYAGAALIQAGLYGLIKTADKEWDDVSSVNQLMSISDSLSSSSSPSKRLFMKGPLEAGLVGEQLVLLSLEEETH